MLSETQKAWLKECGYPEDVVYEEMETGRLYVKDIQDYSPDEVQYKKIYLPEWN